MRCKYSFKINGRIKPVHLVSFEVGIYKFEFALEKGFIREIQVSYSMSDSEPTLIQNPVPGVAMAINIKSPLLREIEEIIRSIEGLWTFWGVESIDTSFPKHEWIAETEEEKQKLQLFGFNEGRKELEDHEISPISFDLLVRPIISAVKTKKHDVILVFYRRGCNDVKQEEFIEAIYDFYFVLESAFANGKNKNYAVKKEFLKSKKLRKYIENTQEELLKSSDRSRYKILLEGKSVDELIKFMVDTRGFLHHHTQKRKDIWNPEKQGRFKTEAFFFQRLCCRIAFDIFTQRTNDDEVIKEYRALCANYNSEV